MGSNLDEKAALKLGRNKNTTAEVLKTVVGKSDKVDRLIAQHQNSDGEVLGKLSGSFDLKTFKLLLLNPKTPFETIIAVASSLISGKDSDLKEKLINEELDKLFSGSPNSISWSRDKLVIEEPDILPPGVRRSYSLPYSEPKVRELLHEYFKNPDCEQLAIQLAKNKKISADTLDVLLGGSISIDRLIAKHPNTDSNMLIKLTGDKAEGTAGSKDTVTRKNAFLNPNLKLPTVADMASEFPDLFIKHPALERLVTGDGWDCPGLIYRVGETMLNDLLSSENCPVLLLRWACRHGCAYQQLVVWRNNITPVELLTEMLTTGYAQEANELLSHPDKLIEFARDVGVVDFGTSDDEVCGKLNQFDLWCNFDSELSELWKKLVPKEGEAETIQGEMVRANGMLGNDFYRSDFCNWFPKYYNFHQFLVANLIDENTFKPFTLAVIRADLRAIKSYGNIVASITKPNETPSFELIPDMETVLSRLDAAVLTWCRRHPDLIPYKRQ